MKFMTILMSPRLAAGLLLSLLAVPVAAQVLNSVWQLSVMDAQNTTRSEARIRLSDEPARSCMDGAWKRAVVEGSAARGEEFFPLAGPLAYKLDGNALTLGRAHVCDSYLFLTGTIEGSLIQGSYTSVGWGSKKLGSFSLQKIQ